MVISKQRFMICSHQLMAYMCFYEISIIYDNKMNPVLMDVLICILYMYVGWYS